MMGEFLLLAKEVGRRNAIGGAVVNAGNEGGIVDAVEIVEKGRAERFPGTGLHAGITDDTRPKRKQDG